MNKLENKVNNKNGFLKNLKKKALAPLFGIGLGIAVAGCPVSPEPPVMNNPPKITSEPVTSVNENQDYNYDMNAEDKDEDTLEYSLSEAPSWLSINSETGVISGTAPSMQRDGAYSVAAQVSDGEDVANQYFDILVRDTAFQEALKETIVDGADRLVETQNNDGGWEWMNPDTDPNTYPESYGSYKNTIGVTAQGLLDAYVLTRDKDYLNAAKDAAGYIEDLSDQTWRIRGPDIPFLVELAEVTGDSNYADLAKSEYEEALTNQGGGTAKGFAESVRDGRQGNPSLISWDINLYVQGALALDRYFSGQGFDDNAKDMTEVIYDSLYVSPVDFDLGDETQSEYWLSNTGAIGAFASTGLHSSERNSLLENLIDSQKNDGHFVGVGDGSDAQTTAYAVMSLLKSYQIAPSTEGVDYLKDSQLSNGGWNYPDENTEVTSEAAQALHDYIR